MLEDGLVIVTWPVGCRILKSFVKKLFSGDHSLAKWIPSKGACLYAFDQTHVNENSVNDNRKVEREQS